MHSHTLSRKECAHSRFFSPELSPKLESGANRANQTARFAPSCSLRLTPNDVIPRKPAHGPAGAHDEESASRCHLRLPPRTLFVRDFFLGDRRISLIS